VTAPGLPRDEALALLGDMVLVRRFEERCAELYGEQKIRGFLHLYVGEEAVCAGAMRAFTPQDAVVATYREHGHALLRGVPAAAVMAEMFGRANGCAKGRGGSMHLFDASRRFFGGWAIVGGLLPLSVGLALADRMSGRRRVTACFFGDGATAEGEFHEALNLASLWKLPVLFLCENNLYAMGTHVTRHTANPDLTAEPRAHRIEAESVDGMDVLAVRDATRRAADAVRESGSPRFLEFRTYRFRAHSMYDAEKYRDKAEVAQWKARDPIDLFAARLRAAGLLDDAALAGIERRVADEIAAAVAAAEDGPLEPVERVTDDVYARPIR
jgi:pyruvate dehydrogenase E1 component subunit alpha